MTPEQVEQVRSRLVEMSKAAVRCREYVLTPWTPADIAALAALLAAGEADPLTRPENMDTQSPIIVCLCGSTRFVQSFMDAYATEIVLSVGRFQPVHGWDAEKKAKLDELHLRKIDLADEVLILNVGGYLGSSTLNELQYARQQNKIVRFLEPLDAAKEGADHE